MLLQGSAQIMHGKLRTQSQWTDLAAVGTGTLFSTYGPSGASRLWIRPCQTTVARWAAGDGGQWWSYRYSAYNVFGCMDASIRHALASPTSLPAAAVGGLYTFVLIAGRRVRRHRLNCIGVADSARKACYCIRRRAIQRPVPPCVQRGTAPLVNNDTDSSDGTAVWYNTTLYEHLRREDEWIIQNLCRLMQPPCGF